MSGHWTKSGLCAAAAAMICVAQPAYGAMGCWNGTQVAAAKIRDLQSRLMVASLRCQAMGVSIVPAYNRFVRANRTTIQGANGVIMAQFRAGHGSQAQTHYDRFATALANVYGADATDGDVCGEMAAVAEEAAAAEGDIPRLIAIADRFGVSPALPGGECRISFASAAPVPGD